MLASFQLCVYVSLLLSREENSSEPERSALGNTASGLLGVEEESLDQGSLKSKELRHRQRYLVASLSLEKG